MAVERCPIVHRDVHIGVSTMKQQASTPRLVNQRAFELLGFAILSRFVKNFMLHLSTYWNAPRN